jgi:hypothetical protein
MKRKLLELLSAMDGQEYLTHPATRTSQLIAAAGRGMVWLATGRVPSSDLLPHPSPPRKPQLKPKAHIFFGTRL